MKRILMIPHIKIQNANALSSPYTIGFPAMTAWLGGVHALQRHLNQNNFESIIFKSAGVICHEINLHVYKRKGDFVNSIVGTGNPLDKNGNRSRFIEVGRCHLTASLIIEYNEIDNMDETEFTQVVHHQLYGNMKLAGGDILDFKKITLFKIAEGLDSKEEDLKKLIRKLMPGYALIERRDLMIAAMESGQDAMDAMLDYLKIMYRSKQDESGDVKWVSQRKIPGWILPIATGFHGITPLGKAINQRDPKTPHRFAESIVTLGEFKMPHHIKNIDEILWHTVTDLKNNLYICQQNQRVI